MKGKEKARQTGREREGIGEGHPNLSPVTLWEASEHLILSDHESNSNVGQRPIVQWP